MVFNLNGVEEICRYSVLTIADPRGICENPFCTFTQTTKGTSLRSGTYYDGETVMIE